MNVLIILLLGTAIGALCGHPVIGLIATALVLGVISYIAGDPKYRNRW